jgi:adenine C2-methylase RlmN of 23S rRNA A2503 and tRNA A37
MLYHHHNNYVKKPFTNYLNIDNIRTVFEVGARECRYTNELLHFYNKTGNRPTFEYIVFKDFNDTLTDAQELVEYCKKVKSKVNIIEYNTIDDCEFKQTSPERLNVFTNYLEDLTIIKKVYTGTQLKELINI